MNLDVNTLLAVMLANVFAMAVSVPIVMGWRVSTSARFVVGSAVSQALAWGSFLLALPINDRLFSSLWIGLLGVSFVCMWYALRGWLGPRPGRTILLAVAGTMPIGYAASFDSYAVRVGVANFGLGFIMLAVCLAAAWPAPHASRRWRGLLIATVGALAVITIGRGVLGAFFTELYPSLRTPHPLNVIGAVLNHIVLTLATIALLAGWHEEAERALRRQADIDGLTQLLNRRAWRERAEMAFALARRESGRLAVLFLDVDHFKRINDEGGHNAGDRALQLIGDLVRTCIRQGDLACRYGGEEFCVLLLGADEAAARDEDARLRAALRAREFAGAGQGVRFSSGLAELQTQDHDLDALLARADGALYAAKSAGRDQLVHAGSAQLAC